MLHAQSRAGTQLTNVRVRVDGLVVKQSIDGIAVPVDPGPHRVEFEASGFAPRQERLEVRQSGLQEMTAVLEELPAPAKEPAMAMPPMSRGREGPRPPAQTSLIPWIAGGTAVAGLAGFTYFGLGARSLASTLDRCAPQCNPADVRTLRTRAYLADASLGIGLVGAAVTAWWFLRPASSPSAKQSLLIVPTDRGLWASIVRKF